MQVTLASVWDASHFSSPQACRFGHVQHLEHLLFYGANMGAQNASGNTALHICALYNQVRLESYPSVGSLTFSVHGKG